uniref:Ig-like domain-containing protein n=1 Tax=Denticeps clupeoides TaxID=299321 RepID=A0AAY4DF58_9TELE
MITLWVLLFLLKASEWHFCSFPIFDPEFAFVQCSGGFVLDRIQGQPALLKTAEPGETVTIECSTPEASTKVFVWYKEGLSRAPVSMVKPYLNARNPSFLDGFNNGRFNLSTDGANSRLVIKQVTKDDVATYYCGVIVLNQLKFISASFLSVTDPSDFAIEQQPVSETAHPGASVTLACSVPTKICSGNHSVYWFRHGSAETHPGIIYTHGDRSAGCEKNPEAGSSTQSCVYHLPKRNLSTTDTGTYYCAVAACGRIIFGTGTELNIRGTLLKQKLYNTLLNPIFLVSITANIILFIAIVPLLAGRFKSRLLAGQFLFSFHFKS